MFDENDAIKFIRAYMPENIAAKYSDDEILNIIDMIWDFYEDNGFLEIPADDSADAEPELPQIMAYVSKMLAKDTADVHYIVEGELAYEKSLDVDA